MIELENKFKVGDKVVPISKSVWGSLDDSVEWHVANEKNQPYLYINSIDADGRFVCSHEALQEYSGDFFIESDLILFTGKVILPQDVCEELDNMKKSTDTLMYALQFSRVQYKAIHNYLYNGKPYLMYDFDLKRMKTICDALTYGYEPVLNPVERLVNEYKKNTESEYSKGVKEALLAFDIEQEGITFEVAEEQALFPF